MAEVQEVRLSADKWVTLEGQRRDFGAMHVVEHRELLPRDGFDDLDPDDEEYEGSRFTGNGAPTLERWYRHAALVMWPRHRRAHILANCNINGAISQLAADLAAGEPAQQCASFAAGIIAHLEKAAGGSSSAYQRAPVYGAVMGYSTSFRREPSGDSLSKLMGCIADMAEAQVAAGQVVGGDGTTDDGAAPVADAMAVPCTVAAAEAEGGGTAAAATDAAAAGADTTPAAAAAGAAAGAAEQIALLPGGGAASKSSPAGLARRCLESVLPGRLLGTQHAAAVFRMGRAVGWALLQAPLMALLRHLFAMPYSVSNAVSLLHGMAQQVQQWMQQLMQAHPQANGQLADPAAAAVARADAVESGFAAAATCMVAACQLAVTEAVTIRGPVNVAHPTTWRDAAPAMLDTLALLGLPPLLPLVQQLLPLAVQQDQPGNMAVLVRLQQRFGWEAIRPAVQVVVSRCEADSSQLPRCLALLRKLAEVAAAAGTPQQAQQVQRAQHLAAAAAGKENAGAAQLQPAAPQAVPPAGKSAEGLQQAQDFQGQVAGLLAATLDVALKEADGAPRNSQFVVDAFAAVHALLPGVGLAPCLTATVAGMPLTGLADRLALLSARLGQLERRYPALECLHPACIQLHTLLDENAERACPALLALTRHTAASIKARSKPLLAPQKDWSITCNLGCTCNDCRAAQSFLQNPTPHSRQFPLPVKQQKHVSSSLKRHVRDLVQHETLRTGRPYKLSVTKTQLFWQQQQGQGKALAAKAAELQKLLPKAAPWEGAAAAAAMLAGA